ncbi:MAG: hypothetical protein GY756_23495, partial [bacterium]|nr:hypothetical protein [bacterium]
YWGDASNIFTFGEYEKTISEMILKRKNVTNILNCNERILVKNIIFNTKNAPDILVLGSSRAIIINSDFFQNNRLMNSSVSGANLEDLIAIYQIYKDRKLKIKKVIIGIDPWIFNDNNSDKRWKSISKFKNGDLFENFYLFMKYTELFSLSYFQSSWEKLLKNKNKNPKETTNKYNQKATKLIDGSIIYGERIRHQSRSIILKKAKSYIHGTIYRLENFNIISKNKYKKFKQLIDDMKKKQIQIEFYLPPYHPYVYTKLKSDYPIVHEIEKVLIKYAKKNNIKVIGSFNPCKLQFSNFDFYDGMHCKPKAVKTLFQKESLF